MILTANIIYLEEVREDIKEVDKKMEHKEIEICGVCGKEFDIVEEGGIMHGDKAVCSLCVRNHPYKTNMFLD